MTKAELLKLARNLGCRGSLSKMSKAELEGAIAKRRASFKSLAADVNPKKSASQEGTQQ